MGNLNKVVYTDHQTVITADNLNAIQDSVIQNTSYITCTTGASTAAKTAALTNFVLTTGSAVKVKFTNSNTAANPTLNVNSTGAKPIMQYGTTVAGTTATESWDDGAVVEFVYDGTNWVMQGRNTIDAVSKANGGTFNGNLGINTANGTASTTGTSTLVLGNATPTGTEGNSRGQVQLFSNGTNYSLMRAVTLTENRTIDLPDAGGTVMVKDGPTHKGSLTLDAQNGTTSTVGDTQLAVGNNKASGTAGNSYGALYLYGTGSNWAGIRTADTLTGNRTIRIPDESGTIALTSNTIQHVSYGTSNDLNSIDHGVIGWCSGVQNKPTNSGNYGYIFAPETTAKSIQTYYEYSSSPDKIERIYHRAYVNNAWTPWYKVLANPETDSGTKPLTITRVNNSYANADAISRLNAAKKSGILWFSCNLGISTGGTFSDFVQIASISGWTAYGTTFLNIPGQTNPSQVLSVYVNTVGSVYIYSAQSITPQFFRGNLVSLSTD